MASQDPVEYANTLRSPRNFVSLSRQGFHFTVETSTFPVRFEFPASDIVKVRFANHKTFSDEYGYSVDPEFKWDSVKVNVEETEERVILRTSDLQVIIDKKPVHFSVLDSNGKFLLQQIDGLTADPALDQENVKPGGPQQQRLIIGAKFKMNFDDHFYGLGEKFRGPYDQSLDWRGRKRDYNASVSQMGNRFEGADGGANGNLMVPFLLNPKRYGLFLDTVYKTYWEFDSKDTWYVKQDCDQDWAAGLPLCEKSEMRFYIVGSSSVPRVLDAYTQLTGRPLMPPRWMLGYLQSSYGYRNWNEVLSTVNRLQKDKFPVDGIFLDLQWFGGVPGMYSEDGSVDQNKTNCVYRRVGSFGWGKNDNFDFSNPRSNIQALKKLGVSVVPIEEGYFDTCNQSIASDNNNFAEGQEKGYFAKGDFGNSKAALFANGDDSKDSQFNEIGYFGQVAMIDTTSAEARRWFWSRHLPILQDGAATFWTDLGEPERYRWWWKYDQNRWHQDIHNVWDLNRARALYDGFTKDLPDRRPFILSRSGYAGSQRYGVGIWSADAPSHLGWAASQPSAHLNLAISGITYTTSDVGGFGGFPVATPEQFTRWLQLEAFSSLIRVHGNIAAGRNADRIVHPDLFPEPFKSINRTYIQWREALIPYIYTHAREAYDTGMPIIRALPLEWPDEIHAQDNGSEYLLGPSILVVPYLRGPNGSPDTTRDIYFPPGRWIDMHDGTEYDGNREVMNYYAPIEKLPLFAREGAILPKAPVLSSLSAEGWLSTRIFEIYPGPSESVYLLYDDDGETNKYKKGEFSKTKISVKPKGDGNYEITVSAMEGPYRPIQQRTYRFEIHRQRFTKVFWSGREIESHWDDKRHRLSFSLPPVDTTKSVHLELK